MSSDGTTATMAPAAAVDDSSRRGGLRRASSHPASEDKALGGGLGRHSAKRKATCLPPETVEYLKAWMMSPEHVAHPYPTEQEKLAIMADTGIELKQLTNWFVNNRKRFWKPQVEAQLRGGGDDDEAPLPQSHSVPPSPPSLKGLMTKHAGGFFAARRTVSQVSLLDDGVGATTSSRRPSAVVSPLRRGGTVSENSSSCGSSDDDGPDDDSLASEPGSGGDTAPVRVETDHTGGETRTQLCRVFVLRPALGDVPSLEDVTTSRAEAAAATGGVLHRFEDRAVAVRVPPRATPEEVRRLREEALEGVRRRCLEEYLATAGATPTHGKRPLGASKQPEEDCEADEAFPAPRPKYRRVSFDLWREACQSARDGYDSSLPSLEEATALFGFAN